MTVVLTTAADNLERAMLFSNKSKNNTGSYAQLIDATSAMIASGLNIAHSLTSYLEVLIFFVGFATNEVSKIILISDISLGFTLG